MIIRRDNRRKGKKRIALFVASVLLVYGIFFSPIAPFFSGVAQTAATPFWKVGHSLGDTFRPFLSYFSSRRELYLENKELKAQIDSMTAKIADRDLLRDENKELKKLLGREDEAKRVLAMVLAKPSQTPYDTVIIDAGEGAGVSKGDMVVFENMVVGEIDDVFLTSSRVTLFSTSGATTTVTVGDIGIDAEAVGLGGGNFEILLPKNSEVSIGDTIYLSDIEPRMFGVVEKIESGTKDAFERVLFKSPVNPFTLTHVEVVL